MTDLTQGSKPQTTLLKRMDKAWATIILILVFLAIFWPSELIPTITFAGQAFSQTAIFISFAVLSIGYLKASGAESTVAKAFEGREVNMIFMAAVFGGISPFCSCEVIPFIAALLVAGAPLSAVMAFWLASPLMDPAMFLITSGNLGFEFAIAKTVSAVSLGLLGGFGVKALGFTNVFANPLREITLNSCGCGSDPFTGKPVWKFWQESHRVEVFKSETLKNALFLTKWLLLAYVLEALMVRFVPSEWIATALGGDGFQPILLGSLLGGPAYLNGYAAVPLIAGLLEQGMSQGAAMSFVIAGGVSCIPAAVAVWALVKPKVFFAYLGFAFIGSLLAGSAWAFYTTF